MVSSAIIPLFNAEGGEVSPARAEAGTCDRGVPIRSVSRAIAVLQAVNRFGSITMMEIARASDVPYPTACRIMQTLLYEGLVEREDGRKRYRPTALVQTLSQGYQGHGELVQAVHPHIAALTKEIGWPISLSTHVGNSMLLRDSTHSLTSLCFNEYHPGFAMPILDCAAGLVHLAFCSEAERQTILGHLEVMDEGEHHNALQMTREGMLEAIAQAGYAARDSNRFTLNPGKTSSIAVPLMVDGEIAGALTVAFFASAVTMADATRTLLPRLQKCASAITDQMNLMATPDRRAMR